MFNKKQGIQKLQDDKAFSESKEFSVFRALVDHLEQTQNQKLEETQPPQDEFEETKEDDGFDEAEPDHALIEQ